MQKIKFNYSVFTALILGFVLILSILAVPLSFAYASTSNGLVENNIFTHSDFTIVDHTNWLNYNIATVSTDSNGTTLANTSSSFGTYRQIVTLKSSGYSQITFSVYCLSKTGTISLYFDRLNSNIRSQALTTGLNKFTLTVDVYNTSVQVGFNLQGNSSCKISWVKLEYGSEFTGYVKNNFENYGYNQGVDAGSVVNYGENMLSTVLSGNYNSVQNFGSYNYDYGIHTHIDKLNNYYTQLESSGYDLGGVILPNSTLLTTYDSASNYAAKSTGYNATIPSTSTLTSGSIVSAKHNENYYLYLTFIAMPDFYFVPQMSSGSSGYNTLINSASIEYNSTRYYRLYNQQIIFKTMYGTSNLVQPILIDLEVYQPLVNSQFNVYTDTPYLYRIYVNNTNSEYLYLNPSISANNSDMVLMNICIITDSNYSGNNVITWELSSGSSNNIYNNLVSSNSYYAPILLANTSLSNVSYYDYLSPKYSLQKGYTFADNVVNVYNGYYNSYNVAYESGYNSGYDVGYGLGNDFGYDSGYSAGYNLGQLEASDYTFLGLVSAVINAPIRMIFGTQDGEGLLNFDVLGTNLSTFILSILSLAFVIVVIKFILKAVK